MRGALIVGIDHYTFDKLEGCVNDAKKLSSVLERDAFNKRNFDIDLLVSQENKEIVTRKTLLPKIEKLFSTTSEIALFYFSGHGTENNLGGYIVTQEAEKYNEGISVQDILNLANGSKASDKIVILDCCNSGHMGNVPVLQNNDTALIREGVSILTASRANQKAYESEGSGVFTSLIIEALEGGAADILGKVTIPNVYGYADQALDFFHQRPLLKSHVSALVSIRDCIPAVELNLIHKISIYFDHQNFFFQLNPSFEPTSSNPNPENCTIFSHLQKFRAARLVEPVGEDHMYDAAMNSKTCKLTPQGKYYWYLAKNKLI